MRALPVFIAHGAGEPVDVDQHGTQRPKSFSEARVEAVNALPLRGGRGRFERAEETECRGKDVLDEQCRARPLKQTLADLHEPTDGGLGVPIPARDRRLQTGDGSAVEGEEDAVRTSAHDLRTLGEGVLHHLIIAAFHNFEADAVSHGRTDEGRFQQLGCRAGKESQPERAPSRAVPGRTCGFGQPAELVIVEGEVR